MIWESDQTIGNRTFDIGQGQATYNPTNHFSPEGFAAFMPVYCIWRRSMPTSITLFCIISDRLWIHLKLSLSLGLEQ